MVKMAWVLFMAGLRSGLLCHDQNGSDETHGGDQEYILSKNQQADGSGGHAHDGREMVLCVEPLFHKNGDEQGSENEFDAFKIQGQQASGQGAQGSAANPPALVKKGYQQAVAVEGDPVWGLIPGNERIGFVGQGKNKVGLFLSGPLVGINHGDAVKQVTGIDNQCGQRCGDQACTTGEKAHGHILHGAGENKQAHGNGPQAAVAALVHDDAKTEAKEYIAGHDRNGIQKGCADGAFTHGKSSLFLGNTVQLY